MQASRSIQKPSVLSLTAFLILTVFHLNACSTAKKNTVELSELHGKKIALVQVDGEKTARSITEVALVNQLVHRGTFILIPKKEVDAAKARVEVDPRNFKEIAQKSGADFYLTVQVLHFKGDVREGYSSEIVEDSVMAEERGEDESKVERVFKVKSLTGHVKFNLQFTDVNTDLTKSGIAEKQEMVEASAKSQAAHLPPVLRFLERLSNDAFENFFEKYD